jgi:hypothetical protein
MKNPYKFCRTDKRKGKREGVSLQHEFDRMVLEFQEILFSEEYPYIVFERFNLQWMEFANAYNSKRGIISIANPRAFYDFFINHSDHIYDPVDPKLPTYVKPLFII